MPDPRDYHLETSVDTTAVEKRLEELLKSAEALEPSLVEQFTVWQVEDMGRRTPRTTPIEQGATTTIYPRGPRKNERNRPRRVSRPPMMRKPILRPELLDKLCDRMRGLKWP